MTDNDLKNLTADDQRLLLEKARRAQFAKDDVILEEGSRRQALYFLRQGFARVERAHLGRGIAVARMGPGEVFGEVSFLEDAGASASVVADEDVEVDILERAHLYSLLGSVPGLAARFYQALALVLSRRLRLLSEQLPPLVVEDVPQVNRFHAPRTGQMFKEQIPPRLVEEVENFKSRMLLIDRGLKDRKLTDEDAQAQVSSACNAIEDVLRRHIRQETQLEKGIGNYVFRETFPFFMLSHLTDRSFTKPRGYAGDFYTIELVYQDSPKGDGRLGRYIDRWFLDMPVTRGVMNRRGLLGKAIKEIMAAWNKAEPMLITNLASGPAREVFDLFAEAAPPNLHATLVDIDHEALAFTANLAKERGLTDQLTFAQDNVVRLSQGRGKTVLSPQQMIYSIGLCDYLKDSIVVTLLNWIYDQLLPGGTVVLGNLDVSNPNKAFMDHVLEWPLIYRTADQLRELFGRSKFQTAAVEVKVEEAGVNLFAFCTKPA
jgi:extracellular factor (EF) 3-hydroxypalmitic acid methyl ester biosynthesis protein